MLLRVKKPLLRQDILTFGVKKKAQILDSNQLRGDKYKSSGLTCPEKGLFSTAC